MSGPELLRQLLDRFRRLRPAIRRGPDRSLPNRPSGAFSQSMTFFMLNWPMNGCASFGTIRLRTFADDASLPHLVNASGDRVRVDAVVPAQQPVRASFHRDPTPGFCRVSDTASGPGSDPGSDPAPGTRSDPGFRPRVATRHPAVGPVRARAARHCRSAAASCRRSCAADPSRAPR